jgi:hypothetical protein
MPISYYECPNPSRDIPGYINALDPYGNYSPCLHWGLAQSPEANRLAVEKVQDKTEHLGVLYRWYLGKMDIALVVLHPSSPTRGSPPWPVPTSDFFEKLLEEEDDP